MADEERKVLEDRPEMPRRAKSREDEDQATEDPSPQPPAPRKRRGQDEENIRVVCRFRPANAREQHEEKNNPQTGDYSIQIDDSQTSVAVPRLDRPKLDFTLDHILPPHVSQEDAWEVLGKPLVEQVVDGFNATIFAYGQTGSGKTYTMFGPESYTRVEDMGIIPRSVDYLFEMLSTSTQIHKYSVTVSVVEVYMEKLRDLLDPGDKKKRLRVMIANAARGVVIQGLKEKPCESVADLLKYIMAAQNNRRVATTEIFHHHSSRSHCVVQINVMQRLINETIRQSKLNFGDLAGSELAKRTQAEGQTLKEAGKIHLGLHVLERTITALINGAKHIPYMESKLTQLLKDSLGGNAKTTLLVACSPHIWNRQETVGTLQFAKRAKTIKNRAKVNEQLTTKELEARLAKLEAENRELRAENRSLKNQLRTRGPSIAPSPTNEPEVSEAVIVHAPDPQLEAELTSTRQDLERVSQNLSQKSDQLALLEAQMLDKDQELVATTQSMAKEISTRDTRIQDMEAKMREMEAELRGFRRAEQDRAATQAAIESSANAATKETVVAVDAAMESHSMKLQRNLSDAVSGSNDIIMAQLRLLQEQHEQMMGMIGGLNDKVGKIEVQNTSHHYHNPHHAREDSIMSDNDQDVFDVEFGNFHAPVLASIASDANLLRQADHTDRSAHGIELSYEDEEKDIMSDLSGVDSPIHRPARNKRHEREQSVVLDKNTAEDLHSLVFQMRQYLENRRTLRSSAGGTERGDLASPPASFRVEHATYGVRPGSPKISLRRPLSSSGNSDVGDFRTGSALDILDSAYFWYSARVQRVDPTKGLYISYDGFESKWNEWIPLNSYYRIAKHETRATGGKESGGIFVFAATRYARSTAGLKVQKHFRTQTIDLLETNDLGDNPTVSMSRDRKYTVGITSPRDSKGVMLGVETLLAGHLVKKGNFLNYAFKRRWFVLKSNNVLEYYAAQHDKKLRGAINLAEIQSMRRITGNPGLANSEEASQEFMFDLATNSRVWHLAAENEDELIDWMTCIDAMLNNVLKVNLQDAQAVGGWGAWFRRLNIPTTDGVAGDRPELLQSRSAPPKKSRRGSKRRHSSNSLTQGELDELMRDAVPSGTPQS